MLNKRLLILSNEPMSLSSSNGRTLLNFFNPKDKKKIANFYIKPGPIEGLICDTFFCVSDSEVLKAFVSHKGVGSVINPQDTVRIITSSSDSSKKIARTPLTMLIRNFFWNTGCWKTKFSEWVNNFRPEAIILQAGDSIFMFKLARELSSQIGIPFIIYNSEDYCFKNYCYFREATFSSLLYPIFRHSLYRNVKQTLDKASISIYITEALKNCYDKEFNKPSIALYTGTSLAYPVSSHSLSKRFSYLGNLGLDRHLGLIDIGNALYSIDESYKLDVYGPVPNSTVEESLKKCKGINYRGVIPYSEVVEIMSNSMLLFHTESFEEFYVRDVKYGFSTKIADSLASGVCFVVYGPSEITCMEYLNRNECACVINNKEDLAPILKKLIEDKQARDHYITNALRIVKRNHNIEANRHIMEQIINDL